MDTSLYQEVRRLEIETNRIINTAFSGEYLSAFKGLGVEFESVRPYVPGDDVRTIDWNVSARQQQLFVRQYREERELSIMIMVDISGSMYFGSQKYTKQQLSARLAALFGLTALKNGDRVGCCFYDSQIRKLLLPRKGRKHVLNIIQQALEQQPRQTAADLPQVVRTLSKVLTKKSVMILITDELQSADIQALKILSRRHDCLPIFLDDPWEKHLPDGFVRLEDCETGEQLVIKTADPAWGSFQKENAEQRESVFTQLQQAGIMPLALSTDQNYFPEIMRHFQRRTKRRQY
jgi:uncharacterized protein (DUF58 family)